MGRQAITVFLVFFMVSTAFSSDAEERYLPNSDRPGRAKGATEVEFFVFVIDIDDIDGAEQNFTVNVFLYLSWNDKRLACEGDMVRRIPLEQVWNPRILIVNQQGLIRPSMPEIAEVASDGTVTYRQRYVGRMSQPLKLSEFPFDKHDFTIQFISTGYSPDELRFVPGTPRARTDLIGGVWQVIVPLVFIVVMSWGGFWIDPTNAGAQIGVATSSILTLIAYRFMLGNLLPRLPYMTRLDYFTLGSTALVFFTLVEVIITTKLVLSKRAVFGRKIDCWCRVVFPVAFVLWSVLSLLY